MRLKQFDVTFSTDQRQRSFIGEFRFHVAGGRIELLPVLGWQDSVGDGSNLDIAKANPLEMVCLTVRYSIHSSLWLVSKTSEISSHAAKCSGS